MKAFYRCVTLLRWNKGRYSFFFSMPRAWHKRHNRLVGWHSFFFFFFLLFFIYFLLLLFYFLLFLFSFFPFFFDKTKKDEKDKTWICRQKIRISTNISSNGGGICYGCLFWSRWVSIRTYFHASTYLWLLHEWRVQRT